MQMSFNGKLAKDNPVGQRRKWLAEHWLSGLLQLYFIYILLYFHMLCFVSYTYLNFQEWAGQKMALFKGMQSAL